MHLLGGVHVATEHGRTNWTGSREGKWGEQGGMWLQAGLKDLQVLELPLRGWGASLTPPFLSGNHVPSLNVLPSHRQETETQPGSCGIGLGF